MALSVQAQRGSKAPSTINVFSIEADGKYEDDSPLREMKLNVEGKSFTRAQWSSLNATIYSSDEAGYIRLWDVERGEETNAIKVHQRPINYFSLSADKNLLLTASADSSAKMIDLRSLEIIKTYRSDRPLNTCAISPILNHVVLAGGQEAIDVTTSQAKEGHFEIEFWHMLYEERLAQVKGHFGPVNTVAISPNGKMLASAGEDGIVRLHHFDSNYLNSTY